MKRTEMQLRTRSKILLTEKGEALTFGFRLGPIAIFVIANMPEEGGNQEGPLVYIKMDLRVGEDWQKWSSDDSSPLRESRCGSTTPQRRIPRNY